MLEVEAEMAREVTIPDEGGERVRENLEFSGGMRERGRTGPTVLV